MQELNDYGLGEHGANAHEIEPARKFHTMDLLKDNNDAGTRKQEYIDHLDGIRTEYIRDSNGSDFIMDLMDQHPGVFSKNVVHVTTTASSGFAVKNNLGEELPFNSSIFHFVNKQNTLESVEVAQQESAGARLPSLATTRPLTLPVVGGVNDDSNAFTHKHTNDFIALNGDFLGTNTAVTESHNDAASVQQYPGLALLSETNVALDDSDVMLNGDILYARSIARKVLPHKKRISRKLKCGDMEPELMPAVLEPHKVEVEHMQQTVVNTLQFNCQLCGHVATSQLDFFAHLKDHYEPTTPDTILAAMKTSLDALEPPKQECCNNICTIDKKVDNVVNVNVDHVFHDVHLNFADFNQVDATVSDAMQHQQHNQNHQQNDDMKILNSNSIDKCINYVHNEAPPITADEVEFSDTEDMLEGIRNVVDKVSIEDTCDEIDLMAPNGIRTPWFSNNNFSGIAFKSKLFSDVSFSEPLAQMLNPDNTHETAATTVVNVDVAAVAPKESLAGSSTDIVINSMPCDNTAENIVPNSHEEHDDFYDDAANDQHDDQATKSSSSEESIVPQQLRRAKSLRNSNCLTKKDVYSNDEDLDEEEDNEEDLEEAYSHLAYGGLDCGLDAKKQYACTRCNRDFNSSNALKYHLRTHVGVRPHVCDICGKSFFAQGALKSHIRTHTGDKPFKCEHCQRTFRQWGDLKYHTISIHTAEKNHQCEFCGKAFSRKYSLVLHRRIHTSEKNYKCEVCAKSFRASTYLQNHRKIHTGEKPHECDVCTKRFRVSGDLRRHMRIHTRKSTKDDEETGGEVNKNQT